MVTLFRLISYLEGVSYVLLLFATAIKYLLNNEYWVQGSILISNNLLRKIHRFFHFKENSDDSQPQRR